MNTATLEPPAQPPVYIRIPYTPYPLQRRIHEDMHQIRVVNFGRRSGKSLMALMEGVRMSSQASQAGVLRPRGVIAAPTNEMLRENWWTANQMLKAIITQSVISEHRLELIGTLGQIDFKSTEAQGGAGRGSGYDWAVLDEAARIPKDAWESDLEPSLADRMGRALIVSTPNGLNWFYDLFQRANDHDPHITSYQASTIECWGSRFAKQPDALAKRLAWLDGVKTRTSHQKFRQEYLAEFLAGEGQHFSLKAMLYRGELRGMVAGRHYIAGVDVARKDDWMVTAILEVESQQLVALTRSRHQDWAMQKAISVALLDQFPGVLTYVDSTGVGDPIAQDLRAAGINAVDVLFTPKTKSELVENLTVAIDQTYLGIPDQEATRWLIEELKQYESIRMPSGAIRYGAPEGRHDDGVTALMLAAWGLQGQWRQMEEASVIQPNWWERSDNPWEHLAYEHRMKRFQTHFPSHDLPVHPTDLAWTKMAGRN
jgi:hypothetical protein